MPGLVIVLFAVVTPPQLNVAPPVVEDAVIVSLVVVQVNTTGAVMLTTGTVIFCVTVADAMAVQPLDGSVTVTVYDAGVVTVLVAVVTPAPQLKVVPPVVEDAVSITLVTAHVKVAGAATLAFGAVIFWVTVALALMVHPLVGSVTVTV